MKTDSSFTSQLDMLQEENDNILEKVKSLLFVWVLSISKVTLLMFELINSLGLRMRDARKQKPG